MAIEIKGLKADALAATGHIERIRKAYAKLNTIAPAHATDVEALGAQITSASDDVTFAANILGNSAGRSDEQPKDTQVAKPGDVGKVKAAEHDAALAVTDSSGDVFVDLGVKGSPEVEQEKTFPVQPDEPK